MKLKTLNEFNNALNESYAYGCLMLSLKTPKWNNDVLSLIDQDDLYVPEKDASQYGLEDEPHVTILYGLHSNDIDDKDIENLIKTKFNVITIKLDNIDIFENNDVYDVVKFNISNADLNKFNKLTTEFPFSTNYPDYHPHATIAYVKKGMGKKYVQTLDTPIEIKSNQYKYSKPDGTKNSYIL